MDIEPGVHDEIRIYDCIKIAIVINVVYMAIDVVVHPTGGDFLDVCVAGSIHFILLV
jgi:hypothetical protein